MGNNSKAAAAVVERKRKRKKKGRPSLVEIQKRSLRLQQQDQLKLKQNPNSSTPLAPNSSSSHRHHPASSERRVTRRNPNPEPSSSGEEASGASDEEDEDGSSGRRREKKLKLVHRLPNSGADLDIQDEEKKSVKGTDTQQEDALESGSATPLPDKKTLEGILDRLQKKDTYGVYSEPVDPEELPDYHDIIQHPMDFSTVRNKLSSGTYKSLEQFEKDVLLISSNAMEYNAPDTVYFRQARAIQELAKKSFENLRQGGDGTEQEPPKPAARRGRPPNKNKKPAVNASSHDAAPDVTFDSAKPTNNSVIENNQQSSTYDIAKRILAPERHAIFSWMHEQRTDRDEELPSTGSKGLSAKYGNVKKLGPSEETWRKTYKLSLLSSATSNEIPILSTFDRERKILVPVGIQVEHAYARSVARFAAKLGPVGWAIAAKKIERVLPPGTKFGPGWVLDDEPTQEPKQHLSSPSHNTPTLVTAPFPAAIEKTMEGEDHSASQNTPPAVSRSGTSVTTSSSADNNTSTFIPTIENNFSEDNEPKGTCHSRINGFNTSMQNLAKAVVPHGQALSMIHRSGNINSGVINQRQMLNLANQDLVAPDLNVGFQQLSSPSSSSGSRSKLRQQPDLALQL
ncbi:hypothetical protein LUZ61_010528 [Rhynchospora tenuis]|uniref:Bromo domain-containing protein n=1 Tax=Rhynchospora tenuis TaxID=198213 RepID=A0AAD5ZZQ8_9POAL|nr:hypothetical protein LUZ61_010528 [Rhynchospora tenuis]